MGTEGGAIEVLHVDDDEEFLDLARTFLERESDAMAVATESDPRRSLERLGEEEPAYDCVVVDFDMPEMDGLSLLGAIRETFPDLPVILFTGKGSEEIASEAIAAGVTDYLQKSAGSEQFAVLANRIENAVEGYRARREVERTQRRFRKLIEGSVDVVSVFDEEGRWTYVSPSVESVFGYDPDELIGESVFEKIHSDDREAVETNFGSLLEEPGSRSQVLARVRAADESWKYLDVTGTNLLDDPDVEGILLHGHDVTDRKERERALAELHETSRALMGAGSRAAVLERGVDAAETILDLEMASFYLEEDGVLVPAMVAEQTEEFLGGPPVLEPGESLAWGVFESGDALTTGDVRRHDDVANPETPVRSEMIVPMGDHGVFLAASTDVDAFEETDATLAKVLVANVEAALDRAERERLLARQNERLEAFASVVSHDLRNPLNVAMTYVRQLEAELDDERLERIDDSMERIVTIVEGVLALARSGREVADPEPVALSGLATEAWGTAGGPLAHLEIGSVPESILGDRGRLLSLLENLFRNAREHGGDGVTVRIGRTENGFYVEDDGPGIEPDLREQVLESGFTTTEVGTGFGLAIVASIAEAHGWSVTVAEGRDGGARFEFESVETA